MKILGIDHGTRRVGLAVSDPLGITVRGLLVLQASPVERLLDEVARTIEEEEVDRVVVGLPVNMDGTLGERALAVQEFVELLRSRVPVPVETIDERLTSKEADSLLGRKRRPGPKDRGKRDMVAAQILVRDWLQEQGSGPRDSPEGGD